MNGKPCLLDTNIVIYCMKQVQYAELYRAHLSNSIPLISFITAAELFEGAYRSGANTKTYRLIIEEIEKFPIIHCNKQICDIFGKIRTERRNRPIAVPDAFVAATAIAYDLPLVTHNARDFQGITGMSIITESQSDSES